MELQEWVNRRVEKSLYAPRPLSHFIAQAERELGTIITDEEMTAALRAMPDQFASLSVEHSDGLHFLAKVKDPGPENPPK